MRRRALLLVLLALTTLTACGRGVEGESRGESSNVPGISVDGDHPPFLPAPPPPSAPTGGFGPMHVTPQHEQASASLTSAGSSGAACWATPALTEYTLGKASGKPSSVAGGADGTVWFADPGTTSMGRLDSAGAVVRYPLPAGRRPGALAVAPDGSVWFSTTGPAIGHLTASGELVGYAVPPAKAGPYSEPGPTVPGAFAAGPEGAMWFVEAEADLVGRITPAGTITQYSIPSSARMHVHPEGIGTGPDGAVWFTEPLSGEMGRIDVHTFAISEFPLPNDHTGAPPSSVVVGSDGALWSDTGSGLGRMTTKGAGTLFPFPHGRYAPTSIAPGPDGRIWIIDSPDGKVLRMTVEGAVSELPPVVDRQGLAFANVQQLAGGPDAVWVAEPPLNRIGRYACPAAT